jgi:hypothetical protein
MSLSTSTKVGIIKFSKLYPFLLCALAFVSLSESLFALLSEDFIECSNGTILNTPFSWLIAEKYEFGKYSIAAAIYLSIAFRTCIWNKLSELFLIIYLNEQNIFQDIEITKNTILIIILANLVISGFFVCKGICIYIKKR